jgi:hypothetical protein
MRIKIKLYKARTLTTGFRCPITDQEYSILWPKRWIYRDNELTVLNTGEFSREWCYDARKAIQAENSRLFDETGRCNWKSGDYVSMPSKYYENGL